MSAGKVQAVKAWAVVCKGGKLHRREHQSTRVFQTEARAEELRWACDPWMPCSPHRVVLLTGKVK